ncbi:peptidoglycan endopeptidase [Neisseria gonorrhoeae]|uniref:C40 family peptidase n=1 Tax=Neisseria gonorrhoeae TaxID=485 RepID=UPI00109D906A|nr:C40 family peptidase [Neisseria gonorrhoeae]THC38138.1 peptidoglycan endopeptidase [Neisseria gonorrhoeae]
MDSFFKPAVWAVLWLMFAVRPALADELTNLLSSREQILRQFAEDEQPVLPVNRAPARRAGNADELIGNAMGLNEQPVLPVNRAPARRAGNADELIGNAMGLNEQPVLPVNRAPARRAGNADELIGSAMGLLGIAYRYGGTSVSTGFDCSGFMQHIFKRAMGINLPRTSAEQARMGAPVARSELQPGDMVFFRTLGGSRISHVGLYIGNNRFIHAPRTGKNIEITSLSHKYWSGKYAFARRVKKNDPSRFLN